MSYVANYLEAMNEILGMEFKLHEAQHAELDLLRHQRATVRAFLGVDGSSE